MYVCAFGTTRLERKKRDRCGVTNVFDTACVYCSVSRWVAGGRLMCVVGTV